MIDQLTYSSLSNEQSQGRRPDGQSTSVTFDGVDDPGTTYCNTNDPAEIYITSPADGHNTTVANINVSGTAAGVNIGDSVYIYRNGTLVNTTTVQANSTWSASVTLLGSDSIAAKVVSEPPPDADIAWDTITVILTGNNPPYNTIIVPVDGETYTGNVTCTYTIFDANNDNCTIKVEYSTDSGATWNFATIISGNTANGTADVNGETYSFVWNTIADIGNILDTDVQLRITPWDGTDTGPADTTYNFFIDNEPPIVDTDALQATDGDTVLDTNELNGNYYLEDQTCTVVVSISGANTVTLYFTNDCTLATTSDTAVTMTNTTADTWQAIIMDTQLKGGKTINFIIIAEDNYGNTTTMDSGGVEYIWRVGKPILSASKTIDTITLGGVPTSRRPGATILYLITVTNSGHDEADSVVVYDTITSDVELDLGYTSDTVFATNSLTTWTIYYSTADTLPSTAYGDTASGDWFTTAPASGIKIKFIKWETPSMPVGSDNFKIGVTIK